MGVVPFRRPKKKKAPPRTVEEESQRCPECGWKLPVTVHADRDAVGRGEKLVLYIQCPDCGGRLFWTVTFE